MTMDRQDIEALLPFLANGTLEGAEKEEVEAALAEDVQLRTELEALRAIRYQMQAEEMEASPGELGLARLMRDIDREAEPVAGSAPQAENVVPISRLRIWQVAAALILAVGIGQAVLTPRGGSVPEAPQQVAEDSAPAAATASREFGLASGAPEAAPRAAFRVIFAADATEAEMRALLLDAGLEIVAGPSAIGFYDLAPIDGADGIEAARSALTDAGPLVETLEDVAD
ncbi:hypothetical protein HKCCE3408_12185 [Rhodobacterales bacterium HKCCE3408]|nr:hypothetical protein [Rhodobacterales bacterium HKCCE3408]